MKRIACVLLDGEGVRGGWCDLSLADGDAATQPCLISLHSEINTLPEPVGITISSFPSQGIRPIRGQAKSCQRLLFWQAK